MKGMMIQDRETMITVKGCRVLHSFFSFHLISNRSLIPCGITYMHVALALVFNDNRQFYGDGREHSTEVRSDKVEATEPVLRDKATWLSLIPKHVPCPQSRITIAPSWARQTGKT